MTTAELINKLSYYNPSKLDRMWIKHLIMWKYYNGEYKTIRNYYIESCKKHIG